MSLKPKISEEPWEGGPVTALPPDSVLRLAKALGREEFIAACGWTKDGEYSLRIPASQFASRDTLCNMLDRWEIPRFNHGSPNLHLGDGYYSFVPEYLPRHVVEKHWWWKAWWERA